MKMTKKEKDQYLKDQRDRAAKYKQEGVTSPLQAMKDGPGFKLLQTGFDKTKEANSPKPASPPPPPSDVNFSEDQKQIERRRRSAPSRGRSGTILTRGLRLGEMGDNCDVRNQTSADTSPAIPA